MDGEDALSAVLSQASKRQKVSVSFDSGFSTGRFQLCRASKEVLDALKRGDLSYAASDARLEDGGRNVRLCGPERSFRAVLKDTSNQLLLLPPRKNGNFVVQASLGSVLDVDVDVADRQSLKLLMSAVQIEEAVDDPGLESKGFSMAEISEKVALSGREIVDALDEFGCMEIDGRWRGVSRPLYFDAVATVVGELIAEDYSLHKVPLRELSSALESDFHPRIVRHVCDTLRDSEDRIGPDTTECALSFRKIARMQAHRILRTVDSGMDPTAFRKIWQECLPTVGDAFVEGELLKGTVVEIVRAEVAGEPGSRPERKVILLDVADLPMDPKSRCRVLFERKALWSEEEIVPYMSCYGGEAQIRKMLAKFAKKRYEDAKRSSSFKYCAR